MKRREARGSIPRGWPIGLALIALCVQLVIPAGFMIGRVNGAPTLVVCTGHGPIDGSDTMAMDGHGVMSMGDMGHPPKAPKKTPDSPCAFAGHGVVATPAHVPVTLIAWTRRPRLPAIRAVTLTPGRGLAAPPPPPRGPPTTST